MTTSTAVAKRETSLSCSGCGAVVAIEEGQRTAICIYCMTPGVLEKPRAAGPEPAFVMPFVFAKESANKSVEQWKKSRNIFCKSSIKTAKVESMRGVYVPAYLYSCVATTSYSAEIGEEYSESEEYTTTEDGKTVTRTRTVTKTEWRSLSGTHAKYVTDVVVTASKGVPNGELERIEPFDLRALRRMDESVLPGWLAEDPSMQIAECVELARKEAVDDVGRSLAHFMPGDSHRGLTWKTWFEREGTDLVLVPIWVLAVRYDALKPALRVLVNGQTGKAGGDAPLSPVKITIAVLLGLALIGASVGVYFLGTREALVVMSMTSIGRVRCERCQATIEKGDLRCAVCAMTVPHKPAVAGEEVATLKVFRCKGCGAATSWSAEKNALACAFCGAETALETIEDPMEQTDRWVPFAVDDRAARAALSTWQKSLGFFRPSDLAAQSTVDNLRPLWWPAWIFDAHARATWSADSDHGSGRSSWAPHAGDTELDFERILIGASRGLTHKEMDALASAYDLGPQLRDRPAELTGLVEEQFDVQRSAAREKVAAACHALALQRIEGGHIPGRRYRKVNLSLVLADLVTRRVALPAWVLAYRYKGKLFRVVVHGQSAERVIGDAPWSAFKILLTILGGAALVAVIVLIIVLATHGHAPPRRH